MKMFSAILVTLFLGAAVLLSQNPMRVGGELGVQLPMGSFGDAYNTGFGLSGIFQYEMSPEMTLGGTIGYQSWGGKVDGYSFSNIPIMGLINYKFNTTGLIPFIGAEAGLNMSSASYEFDFFGVKQSGSASETNFGINLLGGVESRMNENLSWRINAKYNIIMTSGSSTSFLGINAGLMYHLK
jgi:opacity protein-like surface antigen